MTSRASFLAATVLLALGLSACAGTNGAAPPATQFSTVIEVPGTAEELTNRFFAYTGPVQSKQVHDNTIQFRVGVACEGAPFEHAIIGRPAYSADATVESRDGRARISMSNFISSTSGVPLEQSLSAGAPRDCSAAFERFVDELATAAASAANEDW